MPEIFTTKQIVEMCIDEAEAACNTSEELIAKYRATPPWRVIQRWRIAIAASQSALTAQYLAGLAKDTLATMKVEK